MKKKIHLGNVRAASTWDGAEGFLGGPLFRGSLWPGNCAACGNLPHRRRLGTNPGRRSWSAEDARRPSDVRGDAQGPGTW